MCGQSWNNWKWNMGTKTTTSSLKILWLVEWKTAVLGDKVKIQFLPSGLGWLPTYSLLHNKVGGMKDPACEGEGRILQGPKRAQTAKHLGWVGCGSTSPLMAAIGESPLLIFDGPSRMGLIWRLLIFCGFCVVTLFFLGVKPGGWEISKKKRCAGMGSITEIGHQRPFGSNPATWWVKRDEFGEELWTSMDCRTPNSLTKQSCVTNSVWL